MELSTGEITQGWTIIKPIPCIAVDCPDGTVTVTEYILNLHAHGNTDELAVENVKRELIKCYELLESCPNKTRDVMRTLKRIQKYIVHE